MFSVEDKVCNCSDCNMRWPVCEICHKNKSTKYIEVNVSGKDWRICSDPNCYEYLKLLEC